MTFNATPSTLEPTGTKRDLLAIGNNVASGSMITGQGPGYVYESLWRAFLGRRISLKRS